MQRSVTALMERYAQEATAALAGQPNVEALRHLYHDHYLAATRSGIEAGQTDDIFIPKVLSGLARYHAIGTRNVHIVSIVVEPIDTMHALARVRWSATYDVEGGVRVVVLTVIYMVRLDFAGPKIFGWFTGDENAELRRNGLID